MFLAKITLGFVVYEIFYFFLTMFYCYQILA